MEKAHSLGQTEENISVNTKKIRKGATVSSFGLMAGATEENGSMANSMAKEPT